MSRHFDLMNRGAHPPTGNQLARPARLGAGPQPNPPVVQILGGEEDPLASVLWRTVRSRRWTIAAFTLAVVAIVGTVSLLMKPKYEAFARVVVVYKGDKDSSVLGFKDVDTSLLEDPEDHAAIDTQIAILKTDALGLQVVKDLGLATNPKFTGSGKSTPSQETLLHLFQSGLTISKIKGTRLIEIKFLARDPQLAANIVNTLANDYVDEYYHSRFQISSQVTGFLSDQLKELKAKVEDSQKRLVDYQRDNGILALGDKENIVTATLDDLNKNLTAAEADRVQKEVAYRLARSGQPELLEKVEPGTVLTKLQTQETDLQAQIAQSAVQLGPANPKMIELSKQLAQVQKSLAAESKHIGDRITYEYQGAVNREQMLRNALESQKHAANQMNASTVQADILKHEFETNRALYDDLFQKQKELAISSSLKSSNIWIVDAARPPDRPSEPKILQNIALSLLFGVFGGVLLAFGLEKMNEKTITTLEQAQVLSSFPALGAVPLMDGRRSGASFQLAVTNGQGNPALVSLMQPLSMAAESYKAVLTSLLLARPTPPNVIMVTSALPQEGKTTVSTNLAILLARLRRRVLLVDADLRRPRVHVALKLNTNGGLASLLHNATPLQEKVIACANVPNLFVLPTGTVNLPEDAELLASNFKDLVDSWRGQFDHIVIDTPPVLPVADGVRMSVEADSVVLVVRAGQTARDAFVRAQDLLLKVNAPVSGFVLNAVQLDASEFRYYVSYYGQETSKRLQTGA